MALISGSRGVWSQRDLRGGGLLFLDIPYLPTLVGRASALARGLLQ